MMSPGAPVAAIALLLLAGCSADAGHPERSASPTTAQVQRPGAVPEVPIGPTDPELIQYDHRVSPTRIEVPSVGIDMDVVSVGRLPDGTMELPERVDVAGWYRLSSTLQSEHGNTVIAAHVDSLRYGLGPFALLKDLEEGQVVSVLGEGGDEQRYEVTAVEYYEKDELPVESIFTRQGDPALVLITCGGEFDRESRQYSDNIVVTATPIGS